MNQFRWTMWLPTLAVLALCCGTAFGAVEDRRTLELKLGGSDLIKTAHPFKRVSIADPEIADVVVLSPKEMYVFGKKVGYTSMILWEEGRGKTLLDVVVSLDLTALKEKLHDLYPDQEIKIYGTETGVVLSGTVSSPDIVEQVLRLTKSYLPKEAEGGSGQQGTGRSGSGITNLLSVEGVQQVMLEIKFAEVRRDSTRDWQAALGLGKLGSDFTGAAGIGNVLDGIESTAEAPFAGLLPGGSPVLVEDAVIDGLVQNPGSLLLNFADNPANVFINIDNFTAAFRFLEGEGLARLLAEPRLVTQSGQEASFLAGGEFPIPVPQGGESDAITVEFKEFGVSLVFTPIVLRDGKINLRVAPSVTSITSTSVIPAGIQGANFLVPSLSTRKAETSVQLYDGQTLALAGLLQDNITEQVTKIPGLGDIPILGSLFRSSSFQQDKTDLLVTVTPHLVKPVKEGSISHPGEYFEIPNRFEFYLEGRLEGRREPNAPSAFNRHSFLTATVPAEKQGGMEGEFGQQPVTEEN